MGFTAVSQAGCVRSTEVLTAILGNTDHVQAENVRIFNICDTGLDVKDNNRRRILNQANTLVITENTSKIIINIDIAVFAKFFHRD